MPCIPVHQISLSARSSTMHIYRESTLLLISSGQEWQFHISTNILVVKNANFTLLLTSSGPEWQFYIATDI